jgi:hypothetical protein
MLKLQHFSVHCNCKIGMNEVEIGCVLCICLTVEGDTTQGEGATACYDGCKDWVWSTVLSPTCWIALCSTPFSIMRPLGHILFASFAFKLRFNAFHYRTKLMYT